MDNPEDYLTWILAARKVYQDLTGKDIKGYPFIGLGNADWECLWDDELTPAEAVEEAMTGKVNFPNEE